MTNEASVGSVGQVEGVPEHNTNRSPCGSSVGGHGSKETVGVLGEI